MRHPRTGRISAALAALAVLIALVVVGPRLGVTKSSQAPLWSDQPPTVKALTRPAPNWVEIAKLLKPAVVNVNTKRVEKGQQMQMPNPFGENDPFHDFFQQFGQQQHPRTVRSLGSGFVINPSGYIVTNNHVVDGATEIRVKFTDGRELSGKVLGRDPKTDLALVKVDASGLPVIPLGNSQELQVGEPVMAIGNPFGLEQTVTTGIVSATGRVIGEGPYDDFIQTDASINPGNSGGPLINARGEAIGINTAIFSQGGGSVGIGFAIPINLAKTVVAQLGETGHVVRGWLGVAIQPVTADLAKSLNVPEAKGALVASVIDNSPAAKAGVKSGDVIVDFNGHKISRADELPLIVAQTPVGRQVPVTVVRDGKPVTLNAQIAKLNENEEEQVAANAGGEGQPSLGLSVQTVTPNVAESLGLKEQHGVLVRGVENGSPAATAGVTSGDVILEVDRHPVKSVEDMRHAIQQHQKGTPTLLRLSRKGDRRYVAVATS